MDSFFDEPTSPDGAQSDDQTSPIRQQFPRQSTSSDFFNEPIPRDDDTSSLSRFRDSSIFDNPRLEPKSKKFRGNTTEPTLEEILNPGGMFKGKRVDETDTQAIMRLWISERAAPEVLIWQAELMDRFQKNLINKKAAVSRTFKSLDKMAPQPEVPSALTNAEIHERTTMIATENMRADFVLKSYLRARIYKIQKFAQHILSDYEDAQTRLSPIELRFAEGYLKAWTTYMNDSFLMTLPASVQRLDDDAMVLRPDFTQAVLVRARSDCGPVTLPDGVRMRLPKGSQHMVRYNTVRELIRLEKLDLI